MNAGGSARRSAVFLDRDGTVMEDRGYLSDPEGVRLLPGVSDALRRLRDAGFLLVIVTNQSGVARGLFDRACVDRVNARLRRQLQVEGVEIDGVYVCPHGPDADCACRKPAPGLLMEAARDLDIDLARSYMVGDKDSDAEAGREAGCRSILLATSGDDTGAGIAEARVRDLLEAAVRILARDGVRREVDR